ncbi:hypothetical protein MHYP_G00168940 [Metynnis hypsauchen]
MDLQGEKRTSDQQASNRDYKHSKYDRGHLYPVCHAPTKEAAESTFTLTNAAPQKCDFNRNWYDEVESKVTPVLNECVEEGRVVRAGKADARLTETESCVLFRGSAMTLQRLDSVVQLTHSQDSLCICPSCSSCLRLVCGLAPVVWVMSRPVPSCSSSALTCSSFPAPPSLRVLRCALRLLVLKPLYFLPGVGVRLHGHVPGVFPLVFPLRLFWCCLAFLGPAGTGLLISEEVRGASSPQDICDVDDSHGIRTPSLEARDGAAA